MPNRSDSVEKAKRAALDVLLHNMHGPCDGLPRTAGWGYPEPYTRDLMISSLGILASGNQKLTSSLRHVLKTLARNQSSRGLIPGLVHDPEDRTSSDTTPLFLLAVAWFRRATGESNFLETAVQKAMTWMDYQSPSDRTIVAQLPTSYWRDEQWVLGFGLFVNTLVYSYLRLYGEHEKASLLRSLMSKYTITADVKHRHVHEGLTMRQKPYYALWSYKNDSSEQKVLLGKCLATRPKVLILDEPSRGVDVKTKMRIHETILALADEGTAVLLISSDLPELVRLSDRAIVMRNGHLIGEINKDALSEETVLLAANGEGVASHA